MTLFHLSGQVRRRLTQAAAAGFASLLFFTGGLAFAQQTPEALEMRARVERLEQQNQALMQMLQGKQIQPAAADQPAGGADKGAYKALVEDAVSAELKKRDETKKAEEAQKETEAKCKLENEGYRIGSLMNVTGSFNKDGYLWLKTPNEDFTMHIGFWMQYDNVFWDQSSLLRTPSGARPGAKQGVASGAALGGIGDLEDGTYFRRLRPFLEGTLWDNYEYRLILALENDQFSTSGLDEFWVGVNKLPGIGTIRFGHVKNASGLEGDMTASSRTMTFMERSSYSEAIELNQNFVTGAWFHNSYIDDRVTYTFAAFRADQASSSGTFFGDGQWGWQGRLTALPIYDCDGRNLLHLGLSGGWRNGTNSLTTSSDRTFQLRARPELRDDDPAGSPTGGQAVPDADSSRIVDTGSIVARREFLTGLELLYIRGPFSLQSEYGFNWVDHAIGFAPTGFTLNPKLTSPQNYVFNGGYVQLAYTLTGENRLYDKVGGTLDRTYLRPFTNAWLVRDENGNLNWGIGAWEIAARYSYLNLNDGAGLNRIQGGVLNGWTVGLNWYVNPNIKFQFDYGYDQRSAVAVGAIPGYTQSFGTRVQLSF